MKQCTMWWVTWVRGTKVMTPCLMQSSSGNVLNLPRKWLVMALQHLQLLWMSSRLVLRCTSHVPPNLVILNAILCPSSLQMFHSPRASVNEWGKELKISLGVLLVNWQVQLPPTDSRLRPDQRHLENGEYDDANAEKLRLEKKQRRVSLFSSTTSLFGRIKPIELQVDQHLDAIVCSLNHIDQYARLLQLFWAAVAISDVSMFKWLAMAWGLRHYTWLT